MRNVVRAILTLGAALAACSSSGPVDKAGAIVELTNTLERIA